MREFELRLSIYSPSSSTALLTMPPSLAPSATEEGGLLPLWIRTAGRSEPGLTGGVEDSCSDKRGRCCCSVSAADSPCCCCSSALVGCCCCCCCCCCRRCLDRRLAALLLLRFSSLWTSTITGRWVACIWSAVSRRSCCCCCWRCCCCCCCCCCSCL